MVIFFAICMLVAVGCTLYFVSCFVTEELYPLARKGIVGLVSLLTRVRLRMPVVLAAD
jgi:hypothetical protein